MAFSPPTDDRLDDTSVSQFVALALVGTLLLSTIGGLTGGSGIVAAQQDDPGDTITKDEFRQWFGELEQMSKAEAQDEAASSPRMIEIFVRVYKEVAGSSAPDESLAQTIENNPQYAAKEVRNTAGDGPLPVPGAPKNESSDGNGGNSGGENNSSAGGGTDGDGTNNTTGGGPTENRSVNQIIADFKDQNLGYSDLSEENKSEVNSILVSLSEGNKSREETNQLFTRLEGIFGGAGGADGSTNPNLRQQRRDVIRERLAVGEQRDPLPDIDINIFGLMEGKLNSLAKTFQEGATDVLGNVYDLAFTTAVPENDGWRGIFGTPTNEPFQSLHQNLLSEKLYPVTNMLLGIGIMLLGVSLAVNPLVSRFRALDLIIKFTTFLLFYGFSWAAITLMHGAVNDITLWMRPSEEAMAVLVTSVDKMGATAIGAYFFGSGGILTTAFGLGLELGIRRVLIEYVFPYVFPVLVFILYTSPWQRLRGYASMAIWQYVNALTMVIPIAILLRAATAVEFSPGEGIKAMLILTALFLATVTIPFISTYFFIQMPGKVAGGMRSAASSAASRIGDAKEKIGSGGDVSATDSTATAGSNPDDRTEEAVEARQADETSSGLPSSGTLDSSTDGKRVSSDSPDTTAAEVRKLDEEDHADPMNDEAMKESFFEHPRRTTMEGKLAD